MTKEGGKKLKKNIKRYAISVFVILFSLFLNIQNVYCAGDNRYDHDPSYQWNYIDGYKYSLSTAVGMRDGHIYLYPYMCISYYSDKANQNLNAYVKVKNENGDWIDALDETYKIGDMVNESDYNPDIGEVGLHRFYYQPVEVQGAAPDKPSGTVKYEDNNYYFKISNWANSCTNNYYISNTWYNEDFSSSDTSQGAADTTILDPVVKYYVKIDENIGGTVTNSDYDTSIRADKVSDWKYSADNMNITDYVLADTEYYIHVIAESYTGKTSDVYTIKLNDLSLTRYTLTVHAGAGISSVGVGSTTSSTSISKTVLPGKSITINSTCKEEYADVTYSGDFTTNSFKMPEKNATVTVKARDIVPPKITPQVTGYNSHGWTNQSVTVNAKITDMGSGVNKAEIKDLNVILPGTIKNPVSDNELQLTQVFNSEMEKSFTIYAADKAGNESTNPVNIKIDKTKPVIKPIETVVINPPEDDYSDTTTYMYTDITDNLSGVDSAYLYDENGNNLGEGYLGGTSDKKDCTFSYGFNENDCGQYYIIAIDRAGNETQSNLFSVKLATTDVTINHFIMTTEGDYPSAPDKIEIQQLDIGQNITLPDLRDSNIEIPNAIMLDENLCEAYGTPCYSYVVDEGLIVNLYYKRIKHTVTYNVIENGGYWNEDDSTSWTKEFYYEQKIDVSDVAYKDGWKFNGWNITPIEHDAIWDIAMGTEDITLYALFSREIFVNFVDCKNTRTIDKILYNNETAAYIDFPEINSFDTWENVSDVLTVGWTSQATGVKPEVTSGKKNIPISNDITYYAVYKASAELKYDLQGGNDLGTTESIQVQVFVNAYKLDKTIGEAVKLGNSFKESEDDEEYIYTYALSAWAENEINGVRYDPDSDYTITQNTVMYAIWDKGPEIKAVDRYFTLDQAQAGQITINELLSTATAQDDIDGDVTEKLNIWNSNDDEFKQFDASGTASIIYQVKDSGNNISYKEVIVFIVDTEPKDIKDERYVRFINEKYYNRAASEGGLLDNSIWKTDSSYSTVLAAAMKNRESLVEQTGKTNVFGIEFNFVKHGSISRNNLYQVWRFTPEDIKRVKQYVQDNGIGNIKHPDALSNFIKEFSSCKG